MDPRGNGGNRRSTKLVEMSEEVAAFIEAAFKTKIKNSERVPRNNIMQFLIIGS